MHRFGRSAQQKMKDRWGGGFILATVLALAGAWYLGGYLSEKLGGAASDLNPTGYGVVSPNGSKSANSNMAMEPHEFQLHFVQVGAFRSEASANRLARDLSNNYSTMVAPKNAAGLFRVMVGPFTSPEAATNAKSKLTAENQGAYSVAVTVAHDPTAVPVAAMTGKAGDDIRKGLDLLNSYLYEAAVWMENREATAQVDAAAVAAMGKQMKDFGASMKNEKDAKVQEFVKMAETASANAMAIETASAAMPASDEYMSAMNGYMSLLEQYRSFHASK